MVSSSFVNSLIRRGLLRFFRSLLADPTNLYIPGCVLDFYHSTIFVRKDDDLLLEHLNIAGP